MIFAMKLGKKCNVLLNWQKLKKKKKINCIKRVPKSVKQEVRSGIIFGYRRSSSLNVIE